MHTMVRLSVYRRNVWHDSGGLLCLPQNSNSENPNCVAIEGVLEAYFQSLRTVQLYGPTNFAPVINQVARWETRDTWHDGKVPLRANLSQLSEGWTGISLTHKSSKKKKTNLFVLFARATRSLLEASCSASFMQKHARFLQIFPFQGAPEPVMPGVTRYWHSVFGVEAGWLDHPMVPEHGTTAAHCSLGVKSGGHI